MMGAANVKAAFGQWAGKLGAGPAFQVLAFMAVQSKDDDDPPAFWGGRESLALALGRTPPHAADDWRAVSRAVRQLEEAGAIARSRHAAPGQTARYELALMPGKGDAQRPLFGGRPVTPEQGTPNVTRSGERVTPGDDNGGRFVTERVTPSDQSGVAQRPPEEEEEQRKRSRNYGARRSPNSRSRARTCPSCQHPVASDGSCGCAEVAS